MVISKKHKFIFIHIPKNAGSSITESLQTVTKEPSHWSVSNYTKHQTLSDLLMLKEEANFVDRILKDFEFLSYYKFAVVRNPFDRIVSLYNYLIKYKIRAEIEMIANFESFVNELEDPLSWVSKLHSTRRQLDFIVDLDGKLSIDTLGRYEELNLFEEEIKKKLGIEFNLKRINVSQESNSNYKKYYSSINVKKIVENRFKQDLDAFNYTF